MAKFKNSKNVTVVNNHHVGNVVAIVVASIAAAILIAIAVLSLVKINPVRGVDLSKVNNYQLYNVGDDDVLPAGSEASQSKIRSAIDDMDFSIMSAILQGKWDYSYNFKRNSSKEKVTISANDLEELTAGDSEFMVVFEFDDIKYDTQKAALDLSNAQSLKVDGETVYFDRLKVLIGNSDGSVGTISIYPYINARIDNDSDIDDVSSDTYSVTGINVRANTTKTYAALKDLAETLT